MEFVVESDHKPLEMISLKNLTAAPPRLQRMLLKLHNYDLHIKYRPGKEMILPDGFSRLPNRQTNNNKIELDIKIDLVRFSTDCLKQLQLNTSKDAICTP